MPRPRCPNLVLFESQLPEDRRHTLGQAIVIFGAAALAGPYHETGADGNAAGEGLLEACPRKFGPSSGVNPPQIELLRFSDCTDCFPHADQRAD